LRLKEGKSSGFFAGLGGVGLAVDRLELGKLTWVDRATCSCAVPLRFFFLKRQIQSLAFRLPSYRQIFQYVVLGNFSILEKIWPILI